MPAGPSGLTDVSPLLQLLGKKKMQWTTRSTVSYNKTSHSRTQNVLKLREKTTTTTTRKLFAMAFLVSLLKTLSSEEIIPSLSYKPDIRLW